MLQSKAQRMIKMRDYQSPLNLRQTECAIKLVKDQFERNLAAALCLERVSAPLFVLPQTGLNDDLNGVERPVSFDVKSLDGQRVEIVHSLAKWKRMALSRYGFATGEGLYTDMNAIRRDEDMDALHSIYVDQWDWEKNIAKSDRTMETLQDTVRKIFQVLRTTEQQVLEQFPQLSPVLAQEITFVTSQQLEDQYPHLSSRQREDAITKEKGAVFIMQIGGKLRSGKKHDGRAPDYDDWTLNGDIMLWNPVSGQALEVSSMGVRVDEEALLRQLAEAGCEERKNMPFHQALLAGELPYSIGGGIGQSRVCMLLLHKAHVGEVQASVWPEEMMQACAADGIFLL